MDLFLLKRLNIIYYIDMHILPLAQHAVAD